MEQNFGAGMSKNAHRSPEKQIPEAGEDEVAGAGNCRSHRKFKNSSKILQAANKFQKLLGTSQEPEEDTEKKKSSDSIQKAAQNARVSRRRKLLD